MYQSYRRVDINNRCLCYSYYLLLMFCLSVIAAMVAFHQGHLAIRDTSVSRFLRTSEPDNWMHLSKCMYDDDKVPCVMWDWLEATEATREDIFVTVYVEDVLQKRVCPRSSRDCKSFSKLWDTVNQTAYFIAGASQLNIDVQQTIIPHFPLGNGGIVEKPNLCHAHGRSWTKPLARDVATKLHGGDDKVKIMSFLWSSKQVTVSSEVAMSGLHVDVTMYYSNVWRDSKDWSSYLFPKEEATYIFCIDADPEADKGAQMIHTAGEETYFLQRKDHKTIKSSDESRVVRTHKGLHFRFRAIGRVAETSWSSALLFVAGALSLLTIPWTIVELLLSLLPMLTRRLPTWYYGALVHTPEVLKKETPAKGEAGKKKED